MNDDTQINKKIEESPEDKNSFLAWIKNHKKQLILAGLSITTIIATIVGLKNKEAIKELWGSLKDEMEKVSRTPFSSKWFETATDTELDVEREKVRLSFCSSGDDYETACSLQNLLGRFDKEMSKRAWGDEVPHAPSNHREHGWYLPNND